MIGVMQIVENQRKRTYPRRFLEKTGHSAEQSKARLLGVGCVPRNPRNTLTTGNAGQLRTPQFADYREMPLIRFVVLFKSFASRRTSYQHRKNWLNVPGQRYRSDKPYPRPICRCASSFP